ncbi:hypothetical protein AGMMS49992_23610 [Clostridia bacterium]|nr:hypothetical protein AGMMS49992_23610 [Clostridia bacterium]
MTEGKPDLERTVCLLLAQSLLSTVWAILGNKIYMMIRSPLRTIIIKRDSDGEINFLFKYCKRLKIIEVAKLSDIKQDLSFLLSAQAVFIPNIEANQRNNIIKYCAEHNIEVITRPKIGDILLKNNAIISETDEYPVFYYENHGARIEYRIIKRSMDIVISLIALILAVPVMIVIALMIKHDDGRPVLYKQVRLTKNEKPFKILKFRSMKVDAEKNGIAVLAVEDDDRITKIGKILRRFRLDELPQLINILLGDMSIVGPRPERPEIIDKYVEELPEFNLRLLEKCGLTGYAQAFGRYNTQPYEKLQMDLIYINNMSLYEDLRIMFYTVRTLFSKEATKGVAEQNTKESRVAA